MNKELITAHMPVCGHPALVTVLYENGEASEVHVEPEMAASLTGRIILAKVEAVEKGISAAFLMLSDKQRAYMPLTGSFSGLRPGDELPVQIVQEALKTKLPKVSPEWEIAGKYLVLLSKAGKPSFSRKLTQEEKSGILRRIGEHIPQDCGILFRTRASGASAEELKEECSQLYQALQDIRAKALSRSCFSVLYEPPSLQQRMISRCQPGELRRFLTDDKALAADLSEPCRNMGAEIELYQDPQLALFRLRSLTTLLDRLMASSVPLRSGGSLVIEQTEAFAVIDVNTSRYTGKRDVLETIRHINREAASEAAKQIRLRQLSGTILIDFINDPDLREEEELGHILTDHFFRDPVYTKLVDFTKLHICEITRRKIHRSLREQTASLKETL